MKCCFCGKEIDGFGNNPSPFYEGTEERCCDECNSKFVVSARIVEMSLREIGNYGVLEEFYKMCANGDAERIYNLLNKESDDDGVSEYIIRNEDVPL